MRTLLALPALLILLLLLPAASAAPPLPNGNVDETVGPCHVEKVTWFEGSVTSVSCGVAGQEVLSYWDGTTIGGHSCGLRVAGQTLEQCPPPEGE